MSAGVKYSSSRYAILMRIGPLISFTFMLLNKVKDGQEFDADITKKDKSVISGYTILEAAMDSHSKVWQSKRAENKQETSNTNQEEAELYAEVNGPDALDEQTAEAETQEQATYTALKHSTVGELLPKSASKGSTRSMCMRRATGTKSWKKRSNPEVVCLSKVKPYTSRILKRNSGKPPIRHS